MHRQRKRLVLPVAHICSQIRSAATATKPIPTVNSQSQWASSELRDSSSKWALPAAAATPTSGPAVPPLVPNISKWSLPLSPPIKSSTKSLPAALSSRPGRKSPKLPTNPSDGLQRWVRRDQGDHNASQSPSPFYSTRHSKLQRDPAPHQTPKVAPHPGMIDLPSHRRGVPRGEYAMPLLDSHRDHGRNTTQAEALRTSQPPNKSELKGKEFDVLDDVEEGAAQVEYLGNRPSRDIRKNRGSLLSRMHEDIAIPGHLKLSTLRSKFDATKPRRNRMHRDKKIAVDVYIPSTVSVGSLARLLGVRLERLQRKMVQAGMGDESSYDHVLTSDYAILLAEEFGRNPVINDEAAFDIYPSPPHPEPASLPSRPPVVTIMGHVDHGKTTLIDTLRSSSVAKGEAGGITQHIGAFSVPVPVVNGSPEGPRTITFLDTPGHAAFSAMRARGASVTDIVVLVVAADDGVMPQTREVIELVKKDKGKVGVVVAINKVDKPGADIDKVQKALLSENIELETVGGDVPSVEVSGLTGFGLKELVETLSAMAEVQDLRAERDGPVHGYILESKVHKGLGPVATVLVLRGCLTPGSHIISGISHAKVRVMNDSSGVTVKTAYPGMAITVSGWKVLPNAGDEVLQGPERDVKRALANRVRKVEVEATLVDVEAINSSRRQDRELREMEQVTGRVQRLAASAEGPKELRLVIKGDVSGSVEAIVGALQGIGNKEAVVKIVSTGVGDVSESDVMMAKATGGMVVAFSVATPRPVDIIAAQNSVPIHSSSIIYRIMDEIKERVIALLPVIVETKVTGEAIVLQLFDVHLKAKQTKMVAGCRVINGIVEKAKNARVVRAGVTIHEGSFDTLRHLKKDITEARKGLECGLSLADFRDLREGDLIQVYQKIELPGTL